LPLRGNRAIRLNKFLPGGIPPGKNLYRFYPLRVLAVRHLGGKISAYSEYSGNRPLFTRKKTNITKNYKLPIVQSPCIAYNCPSTLKGAVMKDN
jgi:hypothetical protein